MNKELDPPISNDSQGDLHERLGITEERRLQLCDKLQAYCVGEVTLSSSFKHIHSITTTVNEYTYMCFIHGVWCRANGYI